MNTECPCNMLVSDSPTLKAPIQRNDQFGIITCERVCHNRLPLFRPKLDERLEFECDWPSESLYINCPRFGRGSCG